MKIEHALRNADSARMVRVGTAALVALVVFASATNASATFPGRNGEIVLSRFGDLYLLNASGDERRLTSGPAFDSDPTWSSDGRRIVFDRDPVGGPPRLYIMRADATHVRALSGSGRHDFAPAFSPNGRRVVFQSDRQMAGNQIWTLGTDGAHPRRLTYLDGWNGRPSFSPDGRRIVFASQHGVRVMRADGSHVRRLTKLGTFDAPSFSPDGRRVALEKDGSIYTIRVDGSGKRPLTQGSHDHSPVYSPNGKRIAFTRSRAGENGSVRAVGIFVIDANGRNLHKLLDDRSADRLDWQPLPR